MDFLRILYTRIRRSGDNIDMTHMGRVLNMELLAVNGFEGMQEKRERCSRWQLGR